MDPIEIPAHHTLKISLHGNKDNVSYSGTLLIRNLSSILPSGNSGSDIGADEEDSQVEDPSGASYYVVAVVMVYGFSIVMLIASHIKRKHHKLAEDRQINKYLQEFMVVQEKSSRDSYRHLKRSIIQKLNRDKPSTGKHLGKAIFPMMAIALPNPNSQNDLQEAMQRRRSVAQASVYQSMEEEHSVQELEDSSEAPDMSMEPFEGTDPALVDEGSDNEVDVEVDADTDEGNHNDSGSTAGSSATYLPAITVSQSEKRKTMDFLQLPQESTFERRVSWSDEAHSARSTPAPSPTRTSPVQSIGEARSMPTSPKRASLVGGECHSIYSKPSFPKKLLKPTAKKSNDSEFEKWMQRYEKRRRSIDPQFDLAAALLRKSLAYQKEKCEKQKQLLQPQSEPKRTQSFRHNRPKLRSQKATDFSDDASVWLVNEIKSPHNGVMREEDPELYTLRHGHGMGSRSPLLKDFASPVTPDSPQFGSRLTPQPLLTPPPSRSRRNPFFSTLTQRSSPEPDNRSPMDTLRVEGRDRSPSTRGSSPSRTSPYTVEGDDENLLHITCV